MKKKSFAILFLLFVIGYSSFLFSKLLDIEGEMVKHKEKVDLNQRTLYIYSLEKIVAKMAEGNMMKKIRESLLANNGKLVLPFEMDNGNYVLSQIELKETKLSPFLMEGEDKKKEIIIKFLQSIELGDPEYFVFLLEQNVSPRLSLYELMGKYFTETGDLKIYNQKITKVFSQYHSENLNLYLLPQEILRFIVGWDSDVADIMYSSRFETLKIDEKLKKELESNKISTKKYGGEIDVSIELIDETKQNPLIFGIKAEIRHDGQIRRYDEY